MSEETPETGEPIERLGSVMKKILVTLRSEAPDWLHGNEIQRLARIKSGSFYPSARDLRRSPWVDWEWRIADDDPNGKPMMHYRLTGLGVALAREIEDGQLKGRQWLEFVPNGWGWS